MESDIYLIKQGDHDAFEAFVLRYRAMGENFAYSMIHDRDLACEIVQDSFVKIYVYRDRINEGLSLKSYLYTIIKNKVIDYMRKTKREVYTSFTLAHSASPEKQIIKQEKISLLNEHINGLKPKQRMALFLYVYEDLSYKDIGEMMGKTEGQIKSLIFRARKKLKSRLGNLIDDMEDLL